MRRRLEPQQRDRAVVIGDLQEHRIAIFTLGDAQVRRVLDGSSLRLAFRAGNDFDARPLAAIGNGDYHWFVVYNGNSQVSGSNDDCNEFFSISGL